MEKTPNNSKRPRGRPATGRSAVVTLALPTPLMARVDASASRDFESRASAIRRLLNTALGLERPS